MNHVRWNVWSALVGLALAPWSSPVSAAGEALVAQIVPLTGAVAKDAQAVSAGVQVGVAATNSRGGIRGTQIKLWLVDDHYQPEETERLLKEAVQKGAVAAMTPVGSASLLRVMSNGTLDAIRLPVVGAVPGAAVLRTPGSPWVFHVRASDDQQIARLVEHAWTVGQRRLAVLYGDIPFGQAGLAATKKQLDARNAQPAVALPFRMANPEADLPNVAAQLRAARADSVLVIGGASQTGRVVKLLREQQVFAPIYSLSYADVATLCSITGPRLAHGVGLAQVVPNHASRSLPIALDFQRDWARHAPKESGPSQYAFEGYIGWRIFVDAMERSGAPFTREGVRKALEGMSGASLGGYQVSFNGHVREGSSFTDIGVVDDACRLRY
jgi:ABC-type branched-subunit amino acid transport system substrate-binding protein